MAGLSVTYLATHQGHTSRLITNVGLLENSLDPSRSRDLMEEKMEHILLSYLQDPPTPQVDIPLPAACGRSEPNDIPQPAHRELLRV